MGCTSQRISGSLIYGWPWVSRLPTTLPAPSNICSDGAPSEATFMTIRGRPRVIESQHHTVVALVLAHASPQHQARRGTSAFRKERVHLLLLSCIGQLLDGRHQIQELENRVFRIVGDLKSGKALAAILD